MPIHTSCAVNEASLIGSDLADRYRLLEIIGEGGMGRVYRAAQLATGQPVAVKLLHPEFADVEQVVQRFEREAKVMTQLAHAARARVARVRPRRRCGAPRYEARDHHGHPEPRATLARDDQAPRLRYREARAPCRENCAEADAARADPLNA